MNNIISKIYALLLFIFPLVCNYDVFFISPSLLFCFLGFVLALLWLLNGNQLIINLKGLIYLPYILVSALLAIMRSNENSLYTIIVKLLLYTLTFIVFYVCYWQIMDRSYAINVFTCISLIVTAIVIVQFVFSKFGKGFCLVLPGIPVAGLKNTTTDEIRANQLLWNRFSSLFFEPAHQAQFVLPCMALVLLRESSSRKKSIIISLFLTLGLFCTTSSIGIIGAIIIWAYYIFSVIKTGNLRKWYGLLPLIPVLIVGIVYFLSRDDLMSIIGQRIGAMNIFSQDNTEGFRRMKYGWFCFARLNTIQKTLGIGYHNIGYYLSKSGIGYSLMGTYEVEVLSYTNGITGMLIGIGFLGTLLNLRLFFFDAIRSKDRTINALLLVWGIVMFTSNAFDDLSNISIMILIMSFVYGEKGKKFKHSITLCIGEKKENGLDYFDYI